MTHKRTADIIIQALELEGITYIFGVPGEENLHILDAIGASNKIKFVVTRHEQAAGFMAATIGRLTGKPAVALSTLGPGATNLMTAAAYAQLGAMPLLMLTGQKPIKHSKQGAFQIIDIVDMMQPLTKFSKQLVEGSVAPSYVREAVRISSEERPGAALIEIPEDVAEEQSNAQPIEPSYSRRPIAEEKSIKKLAELLTAAHKPLVIIGAGANRKRTSNMLTQFVKEYHIPFVDTQMGKGVVDEALPEFAGTAALSSGDYVHRTIEQADLILNVGYDSVEKPPFIDNGEQTIVHINFSSAVVNEIYHPEYEVIGDVANAIWQLMERLKDQKTVFSFDTKYHHDNIQKLQHTFSHQVKSATTLTPQVIVHTLRSLWPASGTVTLDNGMYKIWFARHFQTTFENSLLLDNALATMGAGLPSAIAAKIEQPDKPVAAVIGDGGFMMNSQELETAIRLKLDLTILILNDGAYQMIKWKQQSSGLKDFGLTFNNPDFVKLASSYGAKAHTATNSQELEQAIQASLSSGTVDVINVHIDYNSSAKDLEIT